MDLGRVGAGKFATLKREKRMAERLAEDIGLPVEKTSKMIRKCADAQEKADAEMNARFAARKENNKQSGQRRGSRRSRRRASNSQRQSRTVTPVQVPAGPPSNQGRPTIAPHHTVIPDVPASGE